MLCCVCRAQSAMGNSEVEDPFLKLRKKIIWKAVFHKTLSVQLLKKVLLYVLFLCTVQTFFFYCIILWDSIFNYVFGFRIYHKMFENALNQFQDNIKSNQMSESNSRYTSVKIFLYWSAVVSGRISNTNYDHIISYHISDYS